MTRRESAEKQAGEMESQLALIQSIASGWRARLDKAEAERDAIRAERDEAIYLAAHLLKVIMHDTQMGPCEYSRALHSETLPEHLDEVRAEIARRLLVKEGT
jgi:hypothetical protein